MVQLAAEKKKNMEGVLVDEACGGLRMLGGGCSSSVCRRGRVCADVCRCVCVQLRRRDDDVCERKRGTREGQTGLRGERVVATVGGRISTRATPTIGRHNGEKQKTRTEKRRRRKRALAEAGWPCQPGGLSVPDWLRAAAVAAGAAQQRRGEGPGGWQEMRLSDPDRAARPVRPPLWD